MKKLSICILVNLFLIGYSFGSDTAIGGQYRVMTNLSNFGWHQLNITDEEKSNSYINQRFRINFNSALDDNVKAHVQVEFGHNTWGDGVGTKTIGGTGIELRHAYLTFGVSGFGIKAGIQDWSDGFGDLLASGDWDFNAGGIMLTRKTAVADLKFGMLKVWEGNSRKSDDSELYALDINRDSFGFHLYYLKDRYSVADDLETNIWVGITGIRDVGTAKIDGGFILNTGAIDKADVKHTGYAAKIQGKFSIGSADLGIQALYSTGDDGKDTTDTQEFKTLQEDGQGYWSYLGLFTPRGSSDTNNLRTSIRNRDKDGISRGLTTVQVFAAFPISGNLNGYLAAGLFQATQNDINGSNGMGTEVLAEGKYQISEKLTIEFGGSYALTGDFYKTTTSSASPDKLYELFSRLQVEF